MLFFCNTWYADEGQAVEIAKDFSANLNVLADRKNKEDHSKSPKIACQLKRLSKEKNGGNSKELV